MARQCFPLCACFCDNPLNKFRNIPRNKLQQGNIVLTDKNFEVLTLLRSHRDDDKGIAVMAKHPYPMQVWGGNVWHDKCGRGIGNPHNERASSVHSSLLITE